MNMPETWLHIPVGDSGIYRKSDMFNTPLNLEVKRTPNNNVYEKKLHLQRGWEISKQQMELIYEASASVCSLKSFAKVVI